MRKIYQSFEELLKQNQGLFSLLRKKEGRKMDGTFRAIWDARQAEVEEYKDAIDELYKQINFEQKQSKNYKSLLEKSISENATMEERLEKLTNFLSVSTSEFADEIFQKEKIISYLNKKFEVDTLVNFIPKLKLEEYIGQANSNNVALLQTEKNLAINAYDIKVNQSGYLPTIGLNGSYGWNLNQSAASAFFPGTNNTNWNFGLGASLSWNLFDGGGTTVRVRNSKITYQNQELLKKQVELEVNRDIQNALAIYENRLNIFNIQEQNVLTNQNNFERSKEQNAFTMLHTLA